MSDTPLSMLRLSAAVELEAAAAGDKPRRLSILAYGGGEMTVDGFGPLAIALDGLELPATIPVLADHRNELASIVATGKPTVAAGKLTVAGPLVQSEAAQQVLNLIQSGAALQASVGALPLARKFIAAGESLQVNGRTIKAGDRGLTLISKAILKEISVLPIGADSATAVVLAARKGTAHMPETMLTDPEQIRRDERQRLQEIDRIAAGLNLSDGLHNQLVTLKAKAIDGTLSLDALRAGCLDLMRASRPVAGSNLIITGGANYATSPKHLSAALMVRAGFSEAAEKEYGEHVMEQSKRLHGSSLLDLCKAALALDGRDCPSSRDSMIRAALSTGSLPIALGDSLNRTISAAYLQAPATWRSFATIKPAADFRVQNGIRPSFATPLEEVGPGGEVKHGSYSEETYTWAVDTYAKQVQISRKHIVNDDIGIFAEVIPAMGRAASRGVTNLVYSTMLSGHSTFWTAGRTNLITGATTTLLADGVGLQLGLTALRSLKDSESNYLGLTPHCLLVPPGLERAARELIYSSLIQRSSSDAGPIGNVFENLCEVSVEPRLSDSAYTGYSTTAWWLMSDPVYSGIVVGFLDGMQTPTVEQFDLSSDINTLAYGYRIVFDFGVALGDFRGSIRSKGAA